MSSARSTATDAPGSATTADATRQITVLLGSLLAIAAAFVGSGAFGGPDQTEVGDGALAADATLVAPGQPAFAIWSVIYSGLLAYAVWQALPSRRADPRQRSTGWWVLGSMLLNALWITVVQAGLLGLSVPVIAALVAVLVVVLSRLVDRPASGVVEAVVVDGTLGLYLGWVVVATVANVAAVLTAAGYTELGLGPEVWSWIVLLVAAAIGVGLAVYGHGRLAVGAAIVWGLAWIAVARTSGDLQSGAAASAAVVAAVVVALATIAVRIRSAAPRAR
ncbi:tryptophan-rich sensory protein [uncultured Cellulomonas sp.]|uniref:tryptophan-rich sensory protein n=1 Tax=uncultured Cellulomonas sp. TaxID=189682 RepID=UPI00263A08AB|nr:tryptophan-rich sensory protein [uncultured Cellulomonas sp.]